MIWKTHLLTFGIKNFKNHMNINQNVTFRGMLRRYSRKYPKIHRYLTAATIGTGVYLTFMLSIPGCEFPLQTSIKVNAYKFTSLLFRLWDYNIISPSPQAYIIKLHELILSAMQNQLYNKQLLNYFYSEIRCVAEQNRKSMKSSNYLDLLLYSQIELQNIIRYSNRTLLYPAIYEYYLWLFETITSKISSSTITIQQEKHIKLFYIILQYLINFGKQAQLQTVLNNYKNLVHSTTVKEVNKKGENQQVDHFRFWASKRAFEQKVFLQSLKKLYRDHQNDELKATVLSIFQGLDNIYKYYKVD